MFLSYIKNFRKNDSDAEVMVNDVLASKDKQHKIWCILWQSTLKTRLYVKEYKIRQNLCWLRPIVVVKNFSQFTNFTLYSFHAKGNIQNTLRLVRKIKERKRKEKTTQWHFDSRI